MVLSVWTEEISVSDSASLNDSQEYGDDSDYQQDVNYRTSAVGEEPDQPKDDKDYRN